jgi:hypothetical protein
LCGGAHATGRVRETPFDAVPAVEIVVVFGRARGAILALPVVAAHALADGSVLGSEVRHAMKRTVGGCALTAVRVVHVTRGTAAAVVSSRVLVMAELAGVALPLVLAGAHTRGTVVVGTCHLSVTAAILTGAAAAGRERVSAAEDPTIGARCTIACPVHTTRARLTL